MGVQCAGFRVSVAGSVRAANGGDEEARQWSKGKGREAREEERMRSENKQTSGTEKKQTNKIREDGGKREEIVNEMRGQEQDKREKLTRTVSGNPRTLYKKRGKTKTE